MKTARQVLLLAATIAALSSLALGQVHQIQMGQGMDANPGVGTGGSNRPVQGFVPINGNDIMSGNVTGLAYFHGQVGTASPYSFRGSLGSSSLSSFARQSAGNPANGGPNLGGYAPYYLPSSTVSTAGGSLYSAPIGSGFDSALVPRSSYTSSVSNAQISAVTGDVGGSQAINRSVSATPIQPGTPGAVLSSPLFILRTTEPQIRRPDIGVPIISTPGTSVITPRTGSPGATPDSTDDTTTQPANPNQVQGLVNAGRSQRIVGQNPDYKALVGDTYLSLSEQLSKASGSTEDKPAGAMTPDAKTGLSDIDPLTGRPRSIALLPGLPGGSGLGSATQRALPAGALSAERLAQMSDAELTAGSKIKPVRMANPEKGAQASAFDLTMQHAQESLKDGKYLDAVESYQAALALKPEDPLALIGRANAEMGAGIYAAAEYDLKFVFMRKPQLVALRYDADSFIASSRQSYLLEDFKKLTAKKETAPMASFLYCYLCYQTGRDSDLQAELKAWAGRADKDDWQNVAQRAWGTK